MSLFLIITGLPIQYWQSITRLEPSWAHISIFLSGHINLMLQLSNSWPRAVPSQRQSSQGTSEHQTCTDWIKKLLKNETGLDHGESQVFSLHLYALFWIWTEVHKVLVMLKIPVTHALLGTVGHLLDVVRGAVKSDKLCKISEQKYFLSWSSKQSKNPSGPGLNIKSWLTQSRTK